MLCDELLPLPDLRSLDQSVVINEIPLKCKWNFVLSDIWIPSHLLPNRKAKPADLCLEEKAIVYNTLGQDISNRSKSFSVYDDLDSETLDKKVFISDDKEDFSLSFENKVHQCSSPVELNAVKSSSEASESFEDAIQFSKNSSVCSLHDVESVYSDNSEILHSEQICNTEFNALPTLSYDSKSLDNNKLSEASYRIINKKQLNSEEAYSIGNEANPKKREIKKEKSRWKKAQKHMPLENFLQKDEFNDFRSEEPKIDYFYENVIRSQYHPVLYEMSEFPSLPKTCSNFETETYESSDLSMKNIADILTEKTIGDDKNFNNVNVIEENIGSNHAHIVIENIPMGVAEKDVLDIILGYGELKNFNLKPMGDFLIAELELDLEGDLDWIMECLNGSQPFGACSEMLKCYEKRGQRH